MSLVNGKIHGFEALLHWQHPEWGFLLPKVFLNIAEETDSLIEIGEWLIIEACGLIQMWQKLPGASYPLSLSVNLSEQQFCQQNLVERMKFILSEISIEQHRLCLEITEGVFASQNDTYLTLKRLHDLGIQLHLDDFGTGYSSLSVLQEAPIDSLKINRSFVEHLDGENNDEGSKIVRSIMMLAREMKLNVIANGIETTKQANYLENLNCPCGLGFLFFEPFRADDVTDVFRENAFI